MTDLLAGTANILDQITQSVTSHAQSLLILIAIAFGIHIINIIFFKRALNFLAVRSREPWGLTGLVCAPWLHSDFGHLSINSIFFFILGSMCLVIIPYKTFLLLSLFLSITTGFLTWLLARRANHLGASGVIMGYWGFILVSAIQNPSVFTVITGVICLFYFGTMASNVVPTNSKHSWESHLFGCLCGIAAAFMPIFRA